MASPLQPKCASRAVTSVSSSCAALRTRTSSCACEASTMQKSCCTLLLSVTTSSASTRSRAASAAGTTRDAHSTTATSSRLSCSVDRSCTNENGAFCFPKRLFGSPLATSGIWLLFTVCRIRSALFRSSFSFSLSSTCSVGSDSVVVVVVVVVVVAGTGTGTTTGSGVDEAGCCEGGTAPGATLTGGTAPVNGSILTEHTKKEVSFKKKGGRCAGQQMPSVLQVKKKDTKERKENRQC